MVTNFSIGGGGGGSYDDTELRNRIGVLETEMPEKADIDALDEYYTKNIIDGKLDSIDTEVSNLMSNILKAELPTTGSTIESGIATISSGQGKYLEFPYITNANSKDVCFYLVFSPNYSYITSSQRIFEIRDISDKPFIKYVYDKTSQKYYLSIYNENGVEVFKSDGAVLDTGFQTYYLRLHLLKDRVVCKLQINPDAAEINWSTICDYSITSRDLSQCYIGGIKGRDTTYGGFRGTFNLNYTSLYLTDSTLANLGYIWRGKDVYNISSDFTRLGDTAKNNIKEIVKDTKIIWIGTQEEYDSLLDKTEYQLYMIKG